MNMYYKKGGYLFNSLTMYGGGGFQSSSPNTLSTTTGQSTPDVLQGFGYTPLYNQQDMSGQIQPISVDNQLYAAPQQQSSSFNRIMTGGSDGSAMGMNATTAQAIGLAGQLGASAIDSTRSEYNQQYLGTGPSATQQIVGSAGPWGAAISGVSQLGTSAGDAISGEVDEYGNPENVDQFDVGQGISQAFSPSTSITNTLSSDYLSSGQKTLQTSLDLLGVGFLTAGATKRKEAKNREKEIKAQQEAQEEIARRKRYEQRESYNNNRGHAFRGDRNYLINPVQAGLAYGGVLTANDMNTYGNGGTHEENPYGGIPQGYNENGSMNTVEANEVSIKTGNGEKYIFSDRLIYE